MTRVNLARVFWVGPLSIATSVLAVVTVQVVAVKALSPLPRFSHAILTSTEPAIATAVLVSGAVLIFSLCVRLAADPVRTYRRIALGALLVSCVPNVAAAWLMGSAVDWPSMLALMAMHVVAWAITVGTLTTLTVVEHRTGDVPSP